MVTLQPGRRPAQTLWQRLPHGPVVASRRCLQATPRRRRRQPHAWATLVMAGGCSLLALAVRWPGM